MTPSMSKMTGMYKLLLSCLSARTIAQVSLSLDTKLVGYLLPVKPDHNVSADDDDGDAELAGHLYHLLALLRVRTYIVARVLHPLFGKKVLGHLAEVAGRRRV